MRMRLGAVDEVVSPLPAGSGVGATARVEPPVWW